MTTQQEARLQKRILRLLVTEHCCPPDGTSMSHYPYSDTCMSMLCNTTNCGHFKHS